MLTIVKYILIQSMPIIQGTLCGNSKTEKEITDQCVKHLNLSDTWNSYSVKNEDYYLYNTNRMALAGLSLLFGITGYLFGIRRQREITLISSETETDSLYDTSIPTFKDQMTSTNCTRPIEVNSISRVTSSFYPPKDNNLLEGDRSIMTKENCSFGKCSKNGNSILLPEDIQLPPESFKKTTIYPIKQTSSLKLVGACNSYDSNGSIGSLETVNTVLESIPILHNLQRHRKAKHYDRVTSSYTGSDSVTSSNSGSDPDVILF